MADVFLSYAHSTEAQAELIAESIRALGYPVWRDSQLPAHRDYSDVIEERLRTAKAVVVVWCADAVKSQWVRAEADLAREIGTLVQLTIDGAPLPMPFNRIQCADMRGWSGDLSAPGWKKVAASVADLMGAPRVAPIPPARSSPSLPDKPSIAVMPFANLSGDPAQEYCADGMVEEITTALSRIRSIFVVASNSTLSLKGSSANAHDAARALGVRYLLEGSIRKAADRVRVAVKLLDATSGLQIWAERFDGSASDLFAFQDSVALSVVGVIEPTLERLDIVRESKRPTESPTGYDLYLRAGAVVRTRKQTEVSEALDLLLRAVEIDPTYGVALAAAANCHSQLVHDEDPDLRQWHTSEALRMVQEALRLSGDDAQVLTSAALTTFNLKEDLDGAIALVDRALALNPGASSAWFASGIFRSLAGEPDLAVDHLETSLRLDPLAPDRFDQLAWLGIARFEQRRFAEAVEILHESVRLEPNFGIASYALAACYGCLGEKSLAAEALALHHAASPSATDKARNDFGRRFRRAEHRRLFHDGIARAAGRPRPSRKAASSAGAPRQRR